MSTNEQNSIESFPPTQEFQAQTINNPADYDHANTDREDFWGTKARDYLTWDKPFTEVLDWSNPPFAKWFPDGELNVSVNCIDRHVEAGNGDRVAIHFEGEPGDSRTITYRELGQEVNRVANLLTELGIGQGDRVAIYMPMIPEAVISMQAVARLGAIHTVIFGGFTADSLRTRIDDAEAKLVITADGGFRKGKAFPLKPTVDAALAETQKRGVQESVKNVLVVHRTETEIDWVDGRDLHWNEAVSRQSDQHTPQSFNAENPLFILYTSGTTGKPKGVIHTSGGYLTQVAYTHKNVFDLHPESDIFWCTADIGWITGHSYVAYGPLANGSTQVIYEGTPDFPHPGRWWEIVEKYGVTILYTAPTAIRSFMKVGREVPGKFNLSSIRLIGSVGEPINPEAWHWYREVIGASKVPVVDTWWQTETGAIMISALPGVTAAKPGATQTPIPGIAIDILDDHGQRTSADVAGFLVADGPWPSMLRGLWGDPERFVETYWTSYPGKYFAGDGAHFDGDQEIWVSGRIDDVMNVSGHRLATAEIESALVDHHSVAESAVIGASDELTGQAVIAFVILKNNQTELNDENASDVLRSHVATALGAIARPKRVILVKELPKTRSGKIMRRLLRDLAEGRAVGDTSTLADASVMADISAHF